MRTHAEPVRSRAVARIAAAGVIAGVVAGCSADAYRYGSDPFGSPFAGQRQDTTGGMTTGSLPPAQAAPTTPVTAQPLPQQPAPYWGPQAAEPQQRVPTYASAPPPPPPTRYAQAAAAPPRFTPAPDMSRPASVAAAPSPTYRGPAPRTEITGAVPAPAANDSWAWDGGTAVTVQPGETLDILARRYGVPASAIQRANNLADPRQIQAGQRLVIPAYTYRPGGPAMASAPAAPPQRPPMAAMPAPAPAPQAAATLAPHVVNAGETLSSLARRYNLTRQTLAAANGLSPEAHLSIGQKLMIPGRSVAAPPQRAATVPAPSTPPSAPRRAETAPPSPSPVAPAPAAPKPAPVTVAQPAPSVAPKADPAPTETAALAKPTAPVAETRDDAGVGPGFRWPVKGRVISGFGSKPGGEKNDGINIAVPEGASIKAAEDGTVAYAGSELRGYGNLVLIRHADGWVSAYAHNSELLVKRGDVVKRGQIIGRAGQTGGVSSPQLHFELRRGSTPVDPMPHLAGG